MVLNLLNLFSLIFALFNKIGSIHRQAHELKITLEATSPMLPLSTTAMPYNISTATLATMIVSSILASSSLSPLTSTEAYSTPTPEPFTDLTSTSNFFTTFSDLYATQTTSFTADPTDFITELTTITSTAAPETTLPIEYDEQDQPYYFEKTELRRKRQDTLSITSEGSGEGSTYATEMTYSDLVTTIMNEFGNSTENATELSIANLTDFVTERLEQLFTTTLESIYYEEEEEEDEEAQEEYRNAGLGFPSLSKTTQMSTTLRFTTKFSLTETSSTTPSDTTWTTPLETTSEDTSETPSTNTSGNTSENNMALRPNKTFAEADKDIRQLCWETMFGQELVKLTVMDLVSLIAFMTSGAASHSLSLHRSSPSPPPFYWTSSARCLCAT